MALSAIVLLIGLGVVNAVPEDGIGQTLWHHHDPVGIYESVSIADDMYAIAGLGYNYLPVAKTQLYALVGNGTSKWEVSSPDSYVAGAQSSDLFSTVTNLNNVSKVHMYSSSSSKAIWSYTIPFPSLLSDEHPVDISRDGSTVVVVVYSIPEDRSYIYWFQNADAPSPTVGSYKSAVGLFPAAVSISGDGGIVAADLDGLVLVYDTNANKLRGEYNFSAVDSDLCMSYDGVYFAYTFQTAAVMQWTGTTYKQVYEATLSNFVGQSCAISDNYVMALSWNRLDYMQNRVDAYQLPPNLSGPTKALWTYLYPQNTGDDQDLPAETAISNEGDVIAIAAWGDNLVAKTISVFLTTNGGQARSLGSGFARA
eukprot:TRINITY_DN2757_c0_g1_i2.p1 TRINITY_DN2757_c0_g1~~TRINITY_DN2757_c0_g1_i2.p1  ORF type:complete len:367 (+),score=36.65 TRINITY_DN2757_c0_g1_i2:27-1127(+)